MTDPASPPATPTLAELFNLPGAGQFVVDGKRYGLRKPTQIEQGMWERWLEGEAFAGIERQTHLPPNVLREHRAGLRSDIAAGEYGFLSRAGLLRQNTLDGSAKLASIILMADGHGECDHEFCVRMMLANAEQIAAELVKRAEDGDPKVKAALEAFRSLMTSLTGTPPSNGSTSTAS